MHFGLRSLPKKSEPLAETAPLLVQEPRLVLRGFSTKHRVSVRKAPEPRHNVMMGTGVSDIVFRTVGQEEVDASTLIFDVLAMHER